MKGVYGFIGQRLTEARESRGLRKNNLARLVGVSDPQISKYEAGLQTPSEDVLEKISSALVMPIEYFFYERDRSFDLKSPIYYRSMSNTTQQQRRSAESKYLWLQDIYSYLWRFIEFPCVNLPDIDPPNSVEKISPEYIEEVADYTREYWNLSDAPIENITRLLENNGLVIGFYDLGADTLDGFSHRSFDRPHIIVSTLKASAARIRFSLCHELGHILLHKNLRPETLRNSSEFKLIEKQAHRFAGAFIFPQTSFHQEITSINLSTFRLRKPRWKLAISAMIFRAKDLGIIDDEIERKLRRSYGAKKWSRCEPWDDEIEIDYPEMLKDALELVLSEKVQSRADILEAVPIPREDIEEIIGLEPGFLKDNVVKLRLKSRNRVSGETDFVANQNSSQTNVISFDRHSSDRL